MQKTSHVLSRIYSNGRWVYQKKAEIKGSGEQKPLPHAHVAQLLVECNAKNKELLGQYEQQIDALILSDPVSNNLSAEEKFKLKNKLKQISLKDADSKLQDMKSSLSDKGMKTFREQILPTRPRFEDLQSGYQEPNFCFDDSQLATAAITVRGVSDPWQKEGRPANQDLVMFGTINDFAQLPEERREQALRIVFARLQHLIRSELPKKIGCEILRMNKVPEEDALDNLPLTSGKAYVRVGDELYYVDKDKGKVEEVFVNTEKMAQLDSEIPSNKSPRVLLTDEIAKIIAMTRHTIPLNGGTTFTLNVVCGNTVYTANVGDSPSSLVFLAQDGQVIKEQTLTTSHHLLERVEHLNLSHCLGVLDKLKVKHAPEIKVTPIVSKEAKTIILDTRSDGRKAQRPSVQGCEPAVIAQAYVEASINAKKASPDNQSTVITVLDPQSKKQQVIYQGVADGNGVYGDCVAQLVTAHIEPFLTQTVQFLNELEFVATHSKQLHKMCKHSFVYAESPEDEGEDFDYFKYNSEKVTEKMTDIRKITDDTASRMITINGQEQSVTNQVMFASIDAEIQRLSTAQSPLLINCRASFCEQKAHILDLIAEKAEEEAKAMIETTYRQTEITRNFTEEQGELKIQAGKRAALVTQKKELKTQIKEKLTHPRSKKLAWAFFDVLKCCIGVGLIWEAVSLVKFGKLGYFYHKTERYQQAEKGRNAIDDIDDALKKAEKRNARAPKK